MSQTGTISPTASITDPNLKKVLKAYAANAMHSLSGLANFQQQEWKPSMDKAQSSGQGLSLTTSTGGGSSSTRVQHRKPGHGERDSLSMPFLPQPGPIFLQPDQTSSELMETFLGDVKIACFLVGGEKRLCLPQILNTILSDKDLEDINTVCDDLRIYLAQCTSQQLSQLKDIKVLPLTAPSCGLITLTDAERLCGALLHRRPDQTFHIANRDKCRQMPVVHRCFGKVRGICFVDLYHDADAPCIECAGCKGMFTPRHFVLHSDEAQPTESRLCHWGFDSNNWRHYLFIPDEIGQEAVQKSQPLLEELKRKFESRTVKSLTPTPAKRAKFGSADEPSPFVGKRIKIEEAVYPHGGSQYGPVGWFIPPQMGKSVEGGATGLVTTPSDLAFQFRQPYMTVHNVTVSSSSPVGHLNRGQPVVVNPDKIVFHSPFDKFNDQYAPNVALYSAGKPGVSQSPTPKPLNTTGIAPRSGSRLSESAAVLPPVAGNVARQERARTVSASAATSSHAPDRQRGSFLSDSAVEALTDVAMKEAESDGESSSSSNSTLSTDLVQESVIMEEDEDRLNVLLARIGDPELRKQVSREVGRIRQQCGGMLLQAQHDKMKMEKELQHARTALKDQRTEIQDLKATNARLETDNCNLQLKAVKRWSFSTSAPPTKSEPHN